MNFRRIQSIWFAAACALACTATHGQENAAKPRANRLAKESSPYLLQHAHNPVNWYPWGPEAFARAKVEQKPIFLSVGYSTCYWCHVMERESFENQEIAKYLNEHFICVKVDREERPDVDQIYMAAVQAFQGRGGWPMSVFCFPDGRPFFAGTYYPAADRDGLETFPSLARRVVEAWRDHRAELSRDADTVTALIQRVTVLGDAPQPMPLTPRVFDQAVAGLAAQFDTEYGGFGFDPATMKRPKFPEATNLLFLLEQVATQPKPVGLIAAGSPLADTSALNMLNVSLDHMSRGGIRDHLGGGFHRYSTDRAWAVPHFEKMLYDNALLALVYVRAFEAKKDSRWQREADSIFECVARDFTSPEGGFYSALDAEVDGVEGASYAWTRSEVESRLGAGKGTERFVRVYGLDLPPNFEDERHILRVARPWNELAEELGLNAAALDQEFRPMSESLMKARAARKQPRRDEKILASWNGLMIGAYAEAARVFQSTQHKQAAERAGTFLWEKLRDPKGNLLRAYRPNHAELAGYLEDYACAIWGLLRLHEATGDAKWLARATDLGDRMIARFSDQKNGGFFYTDEGEASLIARTKDFADSALPSANGMAMLALVQLHHATGEARFLRESERAFRAFSGMIARAPSASPTFLSALRLFFAQGGTLGATVVAEPGNDPLGLGTSKSLVTARLNDSEPLIAKPGESIELTLVLKIADGWHVYANPVGSPMLAPTIVELESSTAARLVKVVYPPGVAKSLAGADAPAQVYEGQLHIPVHLQVAEDAVDGEAELNLRVRVQTCDERACLAPSTLEIPVTLRIKRP